MKVMIDTDAKTATFVDGATATTVDPVKETTTVPASQYTSEIGQIFGHAPTTDDPNAWWNRPQTGERETREQLSLTNGQHYNIDAGTVRTVYEVTPSYPAQVMLHVKATVATRVDIGANDLSGAAELYIGGVKVPTNLEGGGNLTSFRATIPAGQTADISLRLDSGDKTFLLVTYPG